MNTKTHLKFVESHVFEVLELLQIGRISSEKLQQNSLPRLRRRGHRDSPSSFNFRNLARTQTHCIAVKNTSSNVEIPQQNTKTHQVETNTSD